MISIFVTVNCDCLLVHIGHLVLIRIQFCCNYIDHDIFNFVIKIETLFLGNAMYILYAVQNAIKKLCIKFHVVIIHRLIQL